MSSVERSKLAELCRQQQLMVVTAESCTGGGIAHAITDLSGSSDWFERGFVTYSNAAKQELLGVKSTTLDLYGAVSEQTALEMALGALQHSHADVAVSVTGIAGPLGGSDEKPVGTVWFGFAGKGRAPQAQHQLFSGDRAAIRRQAVNYALTQLETYIL